MKRQGHRPGQGDVHAISAEVTGNNLNRVGYHRGRLFYPCPSIAKPSSIRPGLDRIRRGIVAQIQSGGNKGGLRHLLWSEGNLLRLAGTGRQIEGSISRKIKLRQRGADADAGGNERVGARCRTVIKVVRQIVGGNEIVATDPDAYQIRTAIQLHLVVADNGTTLPFAKEKRPHAFERSSGISNHAWRDNDANIIGVPFGAKGVCYSRP